LPQAPPDAAIEETEPAEAGDAPERHRLLGVRFHKAGQVFFYPDNEHTVRKGSKVLVQQEQGPALGEVEAIIDSDKLLTDVSLCAQGKVLGLAMAQDIARDAENRILADEASAFCKTCIRQRNLDMKLVDVEVLHDHSKIIFFFTAPTRIDFRELVKDLVRNYRTRIELRQIGVRHESQMIGGLGNCGMVCCCHRYLRKFAPVTIKMAKEQNLFLNPAKLSGMCGRLLCCLSFEQGNYEEFNRRCPKIGKRYVTAAKGTVKVLRANMFNQTIALQSETGEEFEVLLEEWISMDPARAEPPQTEHSPPGQRFPEGGSRRPRPPKEPERSQRYPHRYQDDGSVEEGDLSALEDNPPPPNRRDAPKREGRGPDIHRPPKRGRRE
jgi:cell fate regulator YaaT (PSP1 superfamily)